MARNRRQKTGRSDETSDFSNDFTELLHPPSKKSTPNRPSVTHTSPKLNLRAVEDRREYHPQGPQRAARSLNRPTHTLVLPHQQKRTGKPYKSLPRTVQFEAPAQVAICIRRKTRKEVLFAKQKTGKGSRSKKRNRNYFSSIRC